MTGALERRHLLSSQTGFCNRSEIRTELDGFDVDLRIPVEK